MKLFKWTTKDNTQRSSLVGQSKNKRSDLGQHFTTSSINKSIKSANILKCFDWISNFLKGHNQSYCSKTVSKSLLLPVFASFASSLDLEWAPPGKKQVRWGTLENAAPSSVSAVSCLSPWQCPEGGVCLPVSSRRVSSHSQGSGGSLSPESESPQDPHIAMHC